MPNENDKKPRDKGIGEYAKDFVGDLFGRDDNDDEQKTQNRPAQPNQQQQQQGEERPRDKGIVEYTKDFVGELFGRDDDDKPQAQQPPAAQQPKPQAKDDRSIGERMSDSVKDATEQARQQNQAANKPKPADSFADRMQDAIQDAAEQARDQAKPGGVQSHSLPQSGGGSVATPGATQAPKPASQANETELERLRNRISELERQQTHAAPPAQQQPQRRMHTVAPGESLSKIAKRYYGDMMQWKRIYEANRSLIDNPDLIYPGQEFEIPE